MKVLFKDFKKGKVKVMIDSLNDIWHLSNIIRPGDIISGRSFRTVEFTNEQERKPVWIKIKAENVIFSPYKNKLRVQGLILEGKPEEFIQIGKHHSIDIGEGDIIEIEKSEWLDFEKERLQEAIKESQRSKGYVIIIDERKILAAKIVPYGVEVIAEIDVPISKRMSEKDIEKERKKVFEDLRKILQEKFVAVGGNTFLKDMLAEYLSSHGFEVKTFHAEYAELPTLYELAKQDILKEIVGFARIREEEKIFEKFLMKHLKEGLAAYGEEIEKYAQNGAIEILLVNSDKLKNDRIREICKTVENMGGKVIVFSPDSSAGKKLEGFKGIAAILRFK